MHFYVDGYNLLFFLLDPQKKIQDERDSLILFLQKKFRSLHLKGLIVFDGSHKRDEESGKIYRKPLEIAYAPKGQSADSYIVEKLETVENRKQAIVVTNDKGLRRHATALGASVESNPIFLLRLHKTKESEEKIEKESPQQTAKLLKIFTERLEDP